MYSPCLFIVTYPNPHPNPETPSPISWTVSHSDKRALSAEVQEEFGLGGRLLGSMLKPVFVWDNRAGPLTIKSHFNQVSSTVPNTYLNDKGEGGSLGLSHNKPGSFSSMVVECSHYNAVGEVNDGIYLKKNTPSLYWNHSLFLFWISHWWIKHALFLFLVGLVSVKYFVHEMTAGEIMFWQYKIKTFRYKWDFNDIQLCIYIYTNSQNYLH